jgi:hypothetical protein
MISFEDLAFFRGVSDKYATDRPTVLAPRLDRRPKASAPQFHSAADDWFYKRFGIRYRSAALFLTSRLLSAQTYAATPAHVMRIVPLSDYRYCWSPKVSDLLFAATELANAGPDKIHEYLNSAEYCEGGLAEAHAAGHEVMLSCAQYVCIPHGLLSGPQGGAEQRIILTGPL